MKFSLTCLYCGKEWTEVVYNQNILIEKRCPVCNDKNVDIKDFKKNTIDYYAGSPPFPSPIEDGWPYDQVGID